MSSGIGIDDSVQKTYQLMKTKKKKISYMIMKIEDEKKIVVETEGPEDPEMANYCDFLAKLKEAEDKSECRYAVYDFKYEKNGQTNQKLVFFLWNPEGSKIKSRMLYASSKEALGRALEEGKKFEQVNSLNEMDRDDWCEQLKKLDRA